MFDHYGAKNGSRKPLNCKTNQKFTFLYYNFVFVFNYDACPKLTIMFLGCHKGVAGFEVRAEQPSVKVSG